MDNQKSPQKPEEEDLHEKIHMSPIIHIFWALAAPYVICFTLSIWFFELYILLSK